MSVASCDHLTVSGQAGAEVEEGAEVEAEAEVEAKVDKDIF